MNENTTYHPVEQPDDIPLREREDAMGGYLMMFAAMAVGLPLPVINLIAAIIYYQVNKHKSRFIRFHSMQSLYSQLPTTLLNAGLVFWTIRILFSDGGLQETLFGEENSITFGDTFWGYVAVVVVANIFYFVFSIIAAMKARKGQFYYFPFFGKLAYHRTYKVTDQEMRKTINYPPS